jgi:cysteine dioxygenase
MKHLITINKWYTKYKIPFPIIDIFLFKWKPKIETPIHNHSNSGCIMLVLKGCLSEQIYTKDLIFKKEKNHTKLLNISYINNNIGYHSIKNKMYDNCYSVHFYHPKNHKTKYFN